MLCLADFDHLPAEEMKHALELIRKDPHTLLAYTTISGTGIRVISRYFRGQNCQARSPYDLHLQAFAQINQYYAELIGHPYDEKCKNATRLSGLAHDPDVFFNPEAEAFCIESKMLPKKKETPNRPLKRAVRAAERQLADEGVEYIEHHHNEYIMRTGYLLNAYGIPLETATQWALKRFGDYEGDVAAFSVRVTNRPKNTGPCVCLPLPVRQTKQKGSRQMWPKSRSSSLHRDVSERIP